MLKIRHILFLLCALTFSVSAWGYVVTSSDSDVDISGGKITMPTAHGTFVLSGGESAAEWNWRTSEGSYFVGTVKKSSSSYLTISCTTEAYEINITKLKFKAKAYTSGLWAIYNGKMIVNGHTYTIGTITVGLMGFDNIEESGNLGTNIQIECRNEESGLFGYPFDYFIKEIEITYTAKPLFIFDGSGDGAGDPEHTDWGKPDNWVLNTLPTSTNDVIIRHDVVITETVEAKSVTIESPNKVTVAPTGTLKVGDGGVKNASVDNFKLEAAQTGTNKGQTGVLLISPGCSMMPNATAEMYSKAYFDMMVDDRNNVGSYQYVGSPMVAGAAAKTVFPNSWVYSWYEDSGEWKNKRKTLTLEPFVGYCTSQYMKSEGLLIEHKGQLASNGNRVLDLSYTATSAEPGINVFANSYTAPIDITKFDDADFSAGVEATIYLFNTGSKNQAAEHDGDYYGDAAGQFIEIPIHQAGKWVGSFQWPFVIPAMQGFYVKANSAGSTLTLNYERLVWNATHSNTPLRAKRADEPKKGSLCVAIEADGWRDQVFLLESEEYDAAFENGYDAHKLMQGNLNIFSMEDEEALAVDATNRIAGTRIGVRTGEETAYTLTFGALNGETEWSLYDAETQATIDIEEGMQYTFFAEPNSEIRDRFYITERNDAPAITTDLEEVNTGAASHKFIKDGQLFVMKNGLIYNTLGVVVSR